MADDPGAVASKPVRSACRGPREHAVASAISRPLRQTGESRSRTNRAGLPRLGLFAICLGFFMIQLDATIVNVVLPTIGRDVGGSFAGLQWVLDSYTLVLAAMMLTVGSAADRFGARGLFEYGLLVFVGGSAACAAAPSLAVLIGARAVQGAGAAAMLPCSLALIAHEFPSGKRRARALGMWGGMGSVGVAIGPLLGGVAVATLGWRAIFLVNVPVGLLTVALIRRLVEEAPRRPGRGFDLAGLVFGTVALGAATGGFIEAGRSGWLSGLAPVLLALGVLGLGGFVLAERRSSDPMVPLGLFRSRSFSAVTGVGLLFNLCIYGTLLCLSLYLQRVRGQTPLQAGVTILPMALLVGAGSVLSGRLTARLGPRLPMLTGFAIAAAGALVLSLIGSSTPLGLLLVGSMLLGLCSLAMPAMTAVALGAVDADRAGLASGVLNAARQSGGALGIALLGSLLLAGGKGGSHGLDLHTALAVAVVGYLLAATLSWVATASRGS
jgi:DHA2 family methylenomycin A resistance protein-like MFS transporter